MRHIQISILLLLAGCSGASELEGDDAATSDELRVNAAVAPSAPLSAYFGANNVPPLGALQVCGLPPTQLVDGMPVLFPTEIDPASVTPSAFSVRRGGRVYTPLCATLLPATSSYSASTGYVTYDADQARSFENRTVLLAFPAAALDPNATGGQVSIVGAIRSEDGAISYAGTSAPIVPYGSGPRIGFARHMTSAELPIGAAAPPAVSALCPAGTTDGVLLSWQGGVTVQGQEVTTAILPRYRMTVTQADGSVNVRAVDGLGDTAGDGDNNQIACLVGTGRITAVEVSANTVTDPSGFWNPATRIDTP